jgi:hypothetical protein
MAQNKPVRFGPAYLAASAANILNPPTLTGGTGVPGTTVNCFYLIRHIRIVNKTSSPATFSLYIGATGGSAGGTEFMGNVTNVPANSYVDWYGVLTLDIADYLSGLASAGSTLVFQAEGEIGIR